MILTIGIIILIIFLIFLSSFFAAAEMSFVSIEKINILKEIEKGNHKSKIKDLLVELGYSEDQISVR